MEEYKVVCFGEIKPKEQLQEVKLRLQKLFHIDTDKVELLFSGNPVVVKDYLSKQQAVKYQQAFDQCGAICTIAQSSINLQISGTGDENVNKRNYQRLSLYARAELILDSGERIPGKTLDASFNGFLLQTPQKNHLLTVGQQGMIQISLCEFDEDSFVAFACKVLRITDDGIGLGMISAEDSNLPKKVEKRSQVVVRSNTGSLEEGWSVLHPDDPLPANVVQTLNQYEQKGPVAIVYKKGDTLGKDVFKIEPIKVLMNIQKFANADPDKRIVSHHLVD